MVESSPSKLDPMVGTGIQSISSLAFLGFPFLGYGFNDLLIFLTQALGALVIISFVVTRILRLFIK